MPTLLLLLFLAAPHAPAPAAPSGAPDISGTWEVRTIPGRVQLCTTPGQAAIYNWVVTTFNGQIKVQVTSETGFKKMKGSLDGTHFFAWQKKGGSISFFDVEIDPATMTFSGRRGFVRAGCFIEYVATGRRL